MAINRALFRSFQVYFIQLTIIILFITVAHVAKGDLLPPLQSLLPDAPDSLKIIDISQDGSSLIYVTDSGLYVRDLATYKDTLVWTKLQKDFTLSPDRKILFQDGLFRSVPDGRELLHIGASEDLISFDRTGKFAFVKGPVEVALVNLENRTRVRLLKLPKMNKTARKHEFPQEDAEDIDSPEEYVSACSLDGNSAITAQYLPRKMITWRIHLTHNGKVIKSGSIHIPNDWTNYPDIKILPVCVRSDSVLIKIKKSYRYAYYFINLTTGHAKFLDDVEPSEAYRMKLEISPDDVRPDFTVTSKYDLKALFIDNALSSLSLANLSMKGRDWKIDDDMHDDNPLRGQWMFDAIFNPDGQRILLSTSNGSNNNEDLLEQLLVINSDSGKVVKSLSIKAGHLRFSLNGNDLYIWTRTGAWKVPLTSIL